MRKDINKLTFVTDSLTAEVHICRDIDKGVSKIFLELKKITDVAIEVPWKRDLKVFFLLAYFYSTPENPRNHINHFKTMSRIKVQVNLFSQNLIFL